MNRLSGVGRPSQDLQPERGATLLPFRKSQRCYPNDIMLPLQSPNAPSPRPILWWEPRVQVVCLPMGWLFSLRNNLWMPPWIYPLMDRLVLGGKLKETRNLPRKCSLIYHKICQSILKIRFQATRPPALCKPHHWWIWQRFEVQRYRWTRSDRRAKPAGFRESKVGDFCKTIFFKSCKNVPCTSHKIFALQFLICLFIFVYLT